MSRSPKQPGRPRRFLPALLAVLTIGVAAAAWLLLRSRAGIHAGSWKGDNVLVLTVDTLRADRLPAYGGQGLKTSAIDSLAARGVLFERCATATPLTLPSHTTLFSGTLPIHHGVRDNGAFTVPKELPLLAELFQAQGYATAAFVSAFVLDSRWKLNRGFDVYFDQFDTRKENLLSIGDIERSAGDTMDAALEWLKGRDARKPFLLWVHLFDPHAPYAPPPPFSDEYRDRPYLGEIAYADSQIARLLDFLAGQGLAGKTAVVFAGDHGESLGEHGEDGHGFFAYEATLHVPLIVTPPGSGKAVRRPEIVSLVDVLPTLVELAGLERPALLQGRSLVPLLSGGRLEPRPAYSETYYPRIHFGWSALTALDDGRYKLIESSDPELYDLAADPSEKENLAGRDRERYLAMKRQLASLTAGWAKSPLNAQPAVSDPESVRKLASLGYLTGAPEPVVPGGGPAASPRSKIGVYKKLAAARSLTISDAAKAEKMLLEVLAEDPAVVDARVALASLYLKQHRHAEAIPLLEDAVRRRPADASLALALAMALRSSGRARDGEKFLENRLEGGMADARLDFLLGAFAEQRGDRAAADGWFAKGVAAEPRSAAARSALAEVLLGRSDLEGAEREAKLALQIDPRIEGAHYCLAAVAERRGRPAEAFDEYGREVVVDAVQERSFQALMLLARRLGRLPDEAAVLEESMRRHPDATYPCLYRSRNLLDRREDLPGAVRLAEQGLERASDDRQAAFALFLLADLYDRLGDPERSSDFARRGKALASGAPSGS